jgi:hypothetical protein
MTGKVVGGRVVVEGVALDKVTSVTVDAPDYHEGVTLFTEEEAALLLYIAEADRGETISGEEVLERVASRRS